MPILREILIADCRSTIARYETFIAHMREVQERYTDQPGLDIELPEGVTVDAAVYPSVHMPYEHVATDALLLELLAAGWKLPDGELPEPVLEGADMNKLGLRAKLQHPETYMSLGLNAWVQADTTHCRVEKIGTQMVEKPIFRIHCGEATGEKTNAA